MSSNHRRSKSRRVSVPQRLVGGSLVALVLASGGTASAAGPFLQRTLSDPRIVESSGLARGGYDDNVLWTHNDRGDGPRLFAVDRAGRTTAVATLASTTAVDWEALSRHRDASGRSWLYVGDIGDNGRVRDEVAVHRIPEPRSDQDSSPVPTTFRFRYPDGRHDAEALLVHPRSGRLYIATKDGSGIYEAPLAPSTTTINVLRRVGSVPMTITDGAFLFDGRMVLRDYTRLHVSAGIGQPALTLTLPVTGQGESLAPAPGNRAVLVGSEGWSSPVYWQPLPDL